MSRFVANYVIYNEADFFEKSFRNVIHEMDKVIVTEGCWENAEKITGSLRSTDGTIDILKKLKKEFPDKVEIIYANGRNEQRHRDFGLGKLEDGDIVLWLDGDELIDKKDLEQTKDYAVHMFNMGHQMLFSHYVEVFEIGAVKSNHLRGLFYKFRKDLRYMDDERVNNGHKGEVYLFENYGKGALYNKTMPVIPWELCKVFHYKYCKSLDKIVERRLSYDSIWNNLPDAELENRRKELEEEYRLKYKSNLKLTDIYTGKLPI